MPREITRVTWPLPWWVAAVPALVIAVVSYLAVNRAGEWAYVSSARLSGMPSEALMIAGPVACIAAAWVGERFTNRNSPLASPILVRAAGAQGLRILLVLAVAWGLGHLVGSWVAITVQLGNATGGSFYPVETLISALGLVFFITTGLLIGSTIARWHAPLWAAIWSFLWAFAFPLYYPDISTGSGTNIEYFMFPALPSVDHRSLSFGVMTAVILWWLLVIVSLTALLLGWYRRKAGSSPASLATGAVAVAAVGLLGMWLPLTLASPFVDGPPPPLVCEDGRHLKICVTEEQQVVLPEVVPRVETVLDRMGDHLPEEFTAVVSYYAIESAVAEGQDEAELLVVNIGTGGMRTLEFDLATSIAGLSACHPDTSDPKAVSWAFAFGQWLAPEGDYLGPGDPLLDQLTNADTDSVLDWYTANREALRACAYTGDGPR